MRVAFLLPLRDVIAMEVQINGRAFTLTERATLLDALKALEIPADRQGIAIAVQSAVIPRSEWPAHALNKGDAVEVVTAAQGG